MNVRRMTASIVFVSVSAPSECSRGATPATKSLPRSRSTG